MKLKINKVYIIFGLISLAIMLMAIAGIFVGGKFATIIHVPPLKKLPTIFPKAGAWIPVDWTFPFYFTIQSNFLVIFYFGLVGLGIINPNKNKKALLFELITVMNIFVTALIFWTVLSWNMSFVGNVYLLIENLGLHAFVPLMMISTWIWKTFVYKKQEVFMEYKEFWKFLIYPIVWLIISIIIYYSSRQAVYYVRRYHFENAKLANDWITELTKHGITAEIIKGEHGKVYPEFVVTKIPGVWGNAIYFFLNFDHVPAWVVVITVIGIAILFVLLSLLFISINKSDSKIYKTLIVKKKKIV